MTMPLAGRSILVTRPVHQAAPLSHAIRASGGEPIEFPALAIEALPPDRLADQAALGAHADVLVFVSPNAARYGLRALSAAGAVTARAEVLAVGRGTADRLHEQGVDDVVVPAGQDSEALLALPALEHVAGKRVVIVRGVGGRALLHDTLVARGAQVSFLECYRRVCPDADAGSLVARWQDGGVDAVTIASAETLTNLTAMLGDPGARLLANTPVFAPHEKIAAAARRSGILQVIATSPGDAGLVDGLINWFRKTS